MFLLTFMFPLVYTALYVLAVLFLIKTKNEKFYQKILFSFFVLSSATWGWAELLQNEEGLRSLAFWFTKIGFASALLGVDVLLLICLELLDLHFSMRRFWFFYLLLILPITYCFLPGFIVQGFVELENHLAIISGYADFFYTNLIIISACITLFLFLLVFKLNDQTTRKRVSPVILAFILTVTIGVLFNIFLPIRFNNEAFTSLSPLSMGTVVIALVYSILKWNLLGITLAERVSYSQINQMWKLNSKKIHDQVREAFNEGSKLITDPKVEIKKIIFLGGTVNRSGNVHLYHSNLVRTIFAYYSVIGLVSKKIVRIEEGNQKRVFIILNNASKILTAEKNKNQILDLFSPLSLYQRAAEGAISNHLKAAEKYRPV